MQKRALIVDDSKSARVVLAKILEKYEIVVDAVESAEEALLRLEDERPDVIFMDHLMPSMDGFQAVQAIKNNPLTAGIPILMYTSQGGDLYLGQARALGAAGVLPKQLGLNEVAKALEQLHLLPERRDDRVDSAQRPLFADQAPVGSITLIDAAALEESPVTGPVVQATIDPEAVKAIIEPLLSAQSLELRRFMLATIDGLSARLAAEPRPAAAPVPEMRMVDRPSALPWQLACLLLALLAAGSGFFAWQASTRSSQAEARAATLAAKAAVAAPAEAHAEPVADGAPAAGNPAVPAQGEPSAARRVLKYGYGELPLSGDRLEAFRDYVAELDRRGLSGTVRVTSYAADFCLTGNAAEGYLPAPDDMPATHCDVVGNPADDGQKGSLRAAPEFMDYLQTLAKSTAGRITAVVQHVSHAKGSAYPSAEETNAAAWNRVASTNQLVEFRFEPAPPVR